VAGWRPLSRRGTEPSPDEDALYEGAPNHLAQSLSYWLDALFAQQEKGDYSRGFMAAERRAGRVAARLRLDLRTVPRDKAGERGRYKGQWSASVALVHLVSEAGGAALLDTVDAALADGVSKSDADELDLLLADGGSAWRVADDRKSLEQRVDPTATDAFRQAAAGNPGPHLADAWAAAYGRHPNPSRAYSEAIKAVETASIPVVIPGTRGAKATLGKVIIDLNDHQQDWRLTIHSAGTPSEISPLIAMLRLLWQGQTDRHGGSAPTIPVSASAAEAAVHLAVTLVQWFRSGSVHRVSRP
jgi:hypothetical protein